MLFGSALFVMPGIGPFFVFGPLTSGAAHVGVHQGIRGGATEQS
jgi:hypothetical protein